ncbi:uncharacterized protein LOC114171154 [Vigna unguiculata]|uniref:uncharacterized protein LOC114171154 n=1 Tax=Vigna unguiculata TaxID=3917 RepID=UPI001016136A|nr:uncharacterized protein LOC114171154 [Vigna unguiculata]
MVGSILEGTAQNPLAAQMAKVALESATCVIRVDIMHDIALTRNQLEVPRLRNQLESGLEHQGVATHSFVSNERVRRLIVVLRELGCELIVATPASSEVSTTFVCMGCLIEVADRRFKVNLAYLPIKGLDVILGMDWLLGNHIVIDCGRRSVIFPETVGQKLISAQKAMREVEVGATCFMIVAQGENKSTTEQIRSIPVVDEYADVFPDEIPELPPSRNVDFAIDLILRVGPVSMVPYWMASTELAELKK